MHIVCLDLEGVLVPEIWIAFSEASGIPELKRTIDSSTILYPRGMSHKLNHFAPCSIGPEIYPSSSLAKIQGSFISSAIM